MVVQINGSVESDPAHQLRVGVVPTIVPGLPNGVVGPVPALGCEVGDAAQGLFGLCPCHLGHVVVAVRRRRHDVAVDVVLALATGVVARPDGA